jgi:hypothetical protein
VGPGVTITREARTTLHDALVTALDPLPVTLTRPPDPATPCAWIDVVTRRLADDDGAPVVVVTFPVTIAVDGADESQVLLLDDLGDIVWWVALELDASPTYATPDVINVGGPRLRSLTTSVDVITDYLTLCPPTPPTPTP